MECETLLLLNLIIRMTNNEWIKLNVLIESFTMKTAPDFRPEVEILETQYYLQFPSLDDFYRVIFRSSECLCLVIDWNHTAVRTE